VAPPNDLVTDQEDCVAVDPEKIAQEVVKSMDLDGPLRIQGQDWDKLPFRFVPVSLTAGSVSNSFGHELDASSVVGFVSGFVIGQNGQNNIAFILANTMRTIYFLRTTTTTQNWPRWRRTLLPTPFWISWRRTTMPPSLRTPRVI
jgi:hypothetical protein